MTALPRNITFDCADPYLLVRFWSQVTGFQEDPDVPAALRAAELPWGVDDATYFLSRITIDPEPNGSMAMWRKRLFAAISRNAANRSEYFNLPDDRVVALGGSIEL